MSGAAYGSHSGCRLIFPHPKHVTTGLDLGTGTPTGDKGTRKGRLAEIERQGIVQHTTCARRFHRPPGCAALLVEPTLDPVESGTQVVRWDADPDAHGEATFSLGDHEVEASSRFVLFLF